ncbi:MAG: PKD domain-containing protein, partial [Dysgonamonadaceae bacterium]|nr:PKD domain-containing protein [Dysgonamonadaceae bacterium]
MKNKILNLIVVLFFLGTFNFVGFGQTLTDQERIELARLFAVDIQLRGDSREDYANYQAQRVGLRATFSHSEVLRLAKKSHVNPGVDKVLIIVTSSMYSQLSGKIDRYAHDINNVYGCEVIMESFSGGNHTDVKNLIISNQTDLSGVVFIGDIPTAWYENDNDFDEYAYAVWPCDLYYMDFNGIWGDANGNGIYDSHTGDIQPEIFVGRISTANMGKLMSEKEGLERYLDKNHKFWIGQTTVNNKFGLSYTDHDWSMHEGFKKDIQYLYGDSNYDIVTNEDSFFGKADYLGRLKNNRYEFIQLACHAGHDYLAMSGGGFYSNEVFSKGPEAIGYNLFSCSAANWTAVSPTSSYGFVAGAHVYNAGNSSLVAVGSTKTGSMLSFDKFYKPLGEGKSIGESLKIWWINTFGNTHSNITISWHYGMSIIGDPMINFYGPRPSYLLSVYHKEGGEKMYDAGGFLDKPVGNELTYKIENLDRNVSTDWYYTVKTATGDMISEESNEIHVKLAEFDQIVCEYADNDQESRGRLNNWWGTGNGYYTGPSIVRWTDFAEYYDLQGNFTISGLKMDIAALGNNSKNPDYAKITLKVWTRDNNGNPGEEIHKQDVSFDALSSGTVSIDFDSTVYVTGPFFIGYQVHYSPINRDDFAVTYTQESDPNSPSRYKDGASNWQIFTPSLYVFPNLCPFAPIANFTINESGTNSFTRQFTNTSFASPDTEWLWDFGDETTSTEKDPEHTYAENGIYTITLTAKNTIGKHTIEMVERVFYELPPPPSKIFTWDGVSDTSWDNLDNWVESLIPTVEGIVTILGDAFNFPVLTEEVEV